MPWRHKGKATKKGKEGRLPQEESDKGGRGESGTDSGKRVNPE